MTAISASWASRSPTPARRRCSRRRSTRSASTRATCGSRSVLSRLPDALRGLVALGIDGVNVTLPHKPRALALCDEVSDVARAMGAVNTIVREGERLRGDNTDAEGLVLLARGRRLRRARRRGRRARRGRRGAGSNPRPRWRGRRAHHGRGARSGAGECAHQRPRPARAFVHARQRRSSRARCATPRHARRCSFKRRARRSATGRTRPCSSRRSRSTPSPPTPP